MYEYNRLLFSERWNPGNLEYMKSLNHFRGVAALTVLLFLTFNVGAQDPVDAPQGDLQGVKKETDVSADESLNLEARPAEVSSAALEAIFKDVRDSYLNELKNDVEPNLIRSDLLRLNQNVKRLGSYRKEWVQSAKDFLVANSALSELYLYRYAMFKNDRLNRAILETLLSFQSYRKTKAPLAFFYAFMGDRTNSNLAMELLGRVVEQDPKIIPDAIQGLQSGLGQVVGMDSKLYFAVKACPKLPSPGTEYKEILKTWKSQASGFWEQVLAEELDPCLTGI